MAARGSAIPAGGIRFFRRWLFDQTAIESDWSLGMVRDLPRNAIPTGGAYTLTDFFIERPGMLYKRGGSSYLSSAIAGLANTVGIATPEFPGDPRVISEVSDGGATRWLYDVTSGTPTAGASIGNRQTYENMSAFYIDRLVVTSGEPESGPYLAPLKVYLSAGVMTTAPLGGSPPLAKISCVHAGRLVLANTHDYPDRIWFSPDIDIENTWDTANSWIDTGAPITGLASIQGVLLVFSRGRCQRILGDIPPAHVDSAGNPSTNMSLQPLGDVGCIDARTICYANNLCYFANEHGIYSTNGAGFDSLTQRPNATGISGLWQDTMRNFAPALGAVVSMGVYQNMFLLVSVIHNSGVKSQFLCYLPSSSWVQLASTINATMFATSFAPTHELYIGSPLDTRVRKLSTMWQPSATTKNDAEGTPVTPVWESRLVSTSVGLKRYGFAHLTYDMRDAASDNPMLQTQIATGLEADSGFASVPSSPLGETTAATRQRFTVYKDSQGLSYRLSQQNASAKSEIYFLETEIGMFFVAESS
jgi:hypothetical protein